MAQSKIQSISFFIVFREYKNAITGETAMVEIDFADTSEAEAEVRFEDENALKITNLKELKSKVRLEQSDKKKVKKYKQKYASWGGKALRYAKGQKDKKGGQIIPLEMQQIFRDIAKSKGITPKQAVKKYQNSDILLTNPVDTIGQLDWRDKYNYRTKEYEDGLISEIDNPNLMVKVITSSGEVYKFYGSGKQIYDNPNFKNLMDNQLARVYKAIKKVD